MLRKRDHQLSLADTDNWFERIPKKSFWHRLSTWSEGNLKDGQFAYMYSSIGRPSVPHTFLTTQILIQMRQNWSDSEVIEAAMFDDRVKYALRLSRSPELTCDRSTLYKFRTRALEHDMDRQILQKKLQSAADAGLLSDDEDLVDSYMAIRVAAKQGTFILNYQSIRGLLGQMNREQITISELFRVDYDYRQIPAIYPVERRTGETGVTPRSGIRCSDVVHLL